MSDSREESPDWLRAFEAPTRSVLTLSSGSEASPHGSPLTDDRTNDKEPSPGETSQFPEKDEDDDKPISILTKQSSSKKPLKTKSPNKRPTGEQTPAKKRKMENGSAGGGESAKLQKPETHAEPNVRGYGPRLRSHSYFQLGYKFSVLVDDTGNDGDADAAEEEIAEKNIEPRFSSSRLPLVLSEKVSRTKVSFGQSEAKVEAIMNDFIQLTPQSNVYEAETMVEGTLEGYSFDSDDDADKGVVRKRGKAAVGKPPKKLKKKTQAPKKSKTKK
ncbi:hypothetical protein RHMOL_Rhmol03G0240700 [Rhododendron molle]|uniref:Uncharacterized protein n=1 Tax=Rhododendron molle TaxID=49168 RepID=A0ACC0PK48_RHOML|nr:hypothetical protein RHMOL_Rhmol03G0240700 [Rhododendron molle]